MEAKNVLIIDDGSPATVKMTGEIAAALKGKAVSVKSACEFKGNDILPAEAFFLGCEKPEPSSFAYVTDLLKHINLAGRSCGVFSSGSTKAVKYLSSLVKDSEAAINPQPFLMSGKNGLKTWTQSVISRSF